MSALKLVSKDAQIASAGHALLININSAKSLQKILATNLGPRGTLKMLVSGAGDIKLTKDGNVLLKEMHINHPTASLIARSAVAQDKITGDGTTSNVIIIGEILSQASRWLTEGVHPRALADGIHLAEAKALQFLDKCAIQKKPDEMTNELLSCVAKASLATKVHEKLANVLTPVVVDAILCIQQEGKPIDLHMVEIQAMQHKSDVDTQLVRGLVLDHGPRHPEMPKRLKNCFILTCNVSLEFEKADTNNEASWDSAEQRQRLVEGERKFCDDKVRKIIDLKRQVCDTDDKGFVIINQKGIDPMSLDMLAKEGIMALRRAKRRNMERLMLACGGKAVNSLEDISPAVLGQAGSVYTQILGEEKYTFVKDVKNPNSCSILIKGPNKHTIYQIKDAIRDGLRAVKNTIDDKCVVPGGGAFEMACSAHLHEFASTVDGRKRLGVECLADALLAIPKTLAVNSGIDQIDALLALKSEHKKGHCVGLDIWSGKPMSPEAAGVYDIYRVKRQILHSAISVATNLLLVDEILQAGKAKQ